MLTGGMTQRLKVARAAVAAASEYALTKLAGDLYSTEREEYEKVLLQTGLALAALSGRLEVTAREKPL